MKKITFIKSIALIVVCAGMLTTSTVICPEEAAAVTTYKIENTQEALSKAVSPLDIVNSLKTYLNKDIIIKAKFDKFSTLGLDYKPALKSSENYISFLIQRDDVKNIIPLSEMKLFLKREMAEKYIDLKTNDKIEIKGHVFSDALGDAWIDVNEIKILQKAKEEKNNNGEV